VLLVKEIESDITINLPSFRKRFYVQGASSTADSEPIRAENGSLVQPAFPSLVASRDVSPTLLKVPPKIEDKRRSDRLKSLRRPRAAVEVGNRHLTAGRARCGGERL